MPLHIDPGYIFCKDWVESPSLGRWGFWMYTAHFYSDPGSLLWALQRWCKPQINQQVPHPWHLSGLLTCSPKLGPPYTEVLCKGPLLLVGLGWCMGSCASDSGGLGDCSLVWVPLLQVARTRWKPWAIAPHEARWHHSGDWQRPHLCAKSSFYRVR